MAIFNGYVTNYQMVNPYQIPLNHHFPMDSLWFSTILGIVTPSHSQLLADPWVVPLRLFSRRSERLCESPGCSFHVETSMAKEQKQRKKRDDLSTWRCVDLIWFDCYPSVFWCIQFGFYIGVYHWVKIYSCFVLRQNQVAPDIQRLKDGRSSRRLERWQIEHPNLNMISLKHACKRRW